MDEESQILKEKKENGENQKGMKKRTFSINNH